jgi:hypothetical protein
VFAILALLVLAVGWAAMRLTSSEQMESLRGVRIFGDLTSPQLRAVARQARRVEFPPGEAVTREGEHGQSLYVIEEGSAVVSAGGEPKATLSAPAYVGEVAVIDGGSRTATITAETLVRTVEVSARSLSHLLDSDPGFRRAVYLRLQEIVRSVGGTAPEEPPTVDRSALLDLCAQLRGIQTPDWVQQEPGLKRRGVLAWRR